MDKPAREITGQDGKDKTKITANFDHDRKKQNPIQQNTQEELEVL